MPVGAKADVNVFKDNSAVIPIPASSFVNYLFAGSHLIKAFPVTINDFDYVVTPGETTITIASGQVAEQKIVYAPVDGQLRVAVSDPPPDDILPHPMRVRGSNGFDSGPFNGDEAFKHLAPGTYTITAQQVSNAKHTICYTPDTPVQQQAVVAGQGVTASVIYTRGSCDI